MKFCKIVHKQSVMKKAMRLVSSAKKSIDMTMNLSEEMKSPLPMEYHNVLALLSKKGILIRRYAYGSKKMYEKFKNKFEGVIMYQRGKISFYQRMLIVDKKKGMFVINGNVYYATFKPLIKSLLNYAKIE